MNWEELTAPDFERAREEARGVCLMPIGVLEKHGDHLPLGTDLLVVRAIAERAAALEPVVVFPPWYFGQIAEARHQPGTFALPMQLLHELFEATLTEIARNGFRKIVLLDGHGGNRHLLADLCWRQLERPRDFTAYLIGLGAYYGDPKWESVRETEVDGHAGEMETSVLLATHPELARMEAVADNGQPQGRSPDLAGATTGIEWYADFPSQYAGDGSKGTREKGGMLLEGQVARVAEILRRIKADDVSPALFAEFHRRT